MKDFLLFSLLAFLLSCAEAINAQYSSIDVPYAIRSLHINGQMDADEWVNAHVVELPDTGEIRFTRDSQHLYVALRFQKRGIGSLCVQKNEQVRILHASATLGTAVYTQNGAVWQLEKSFRFKKQEADSSESAYQKRAVFLMNHGWFASTVSMDGDETTTFLEYKIGLYLFDSVRPKLGVAGKLLESNQEFIHLPKTLDDDCSGPELIRGFPPEQVQFNPLGWLHLAIGN